VTHLTKMCQYRIVACILLILSIFSFMLAAPIAVQEVREACANAVDEGGDVIIGLAKRTEVQEKEDPMKYWLTQGQQEPSSSSDWRSTPSQHQGSSSMPNYASGTHPNPPFSSGESKPSPLSTSGGTELSWNPESEAKLIQSGTSAEIQPTSSSKAKSVSWAPSKGVKLPSGDIISEPLLLPEIKPLPRPLGRDAYLVKVAAQQSPSPGIEHTSPSSYFNLPPPLGWDKYLAKMAKQQSGFFRDPMKALKKFGKLKFRPRFWRISGTVSVQ
jgi:hypothetical protein